MAAITLRAKTLLNLLARAETRHVRGVNRRRSRARKIDSTSS
jgi:hypothetical protein